MRDINDGFPSGSHPYTEDYDYLSDSDLEDGFYFSGENEESRDIGGSSQQRLKNEEDAETIGVVAADTPPSSPSPLGTSDTRNNNRSFLLPTGYFMILADQILVLVIVVREWVRLQ